MNCFNNILVIVDPTASEHPAVAKAMRLAVHCNSRVELFACETKESRSARYAKHLAGGAKGDFIVDVRRLLEPLAQLGRDQGLDVSIETTPGDPLYAKLLERAAHTSADFIVKDTHHHSLAQRTFLTHTDWQLIRGCPVPLLLTKPMPWPAAPVIAAALDPEHVNDKPEALDHRILEHAHYLATNLGGTLHAVNAYLPLTIAAESASGTPAMTLFSTEMLESLRAARQEMVDRLIRPYGVMPDNVHVMLGVAPDVLPMVAADFAVNVMTMGAISRSAMQRLLLGSTAERVLERVTCDVMIVKSPDFAAHLPF